MRKDQKKNVHMFECVRTIWSTDSSDDEVSAKYKMSRLVHSETVSQKCISWVFEGEAAAKIMLRQNKKSRLCPRRNFRRIVMRVNDTGAT